MYKFLSLLLSLFLIETGSIYSQEGKTQSNTGIVVSEEEVITAEFGKLEITSYLAGKLFIDNTFIKDVRQNTKFTLSGISIGNHNLELQGTTNYKTQISIYKDETSLLTLSGSNISSSDANISSANTNNSQIEKKGTFTDTRDGREYSWTRIGSTLWMTENLAYNPGGQGFWSYKNEESNVETFGYLYDWETAQKACPEGWRLPTKYDFTYLRQNLGVRPRSVFISGIEGGASGFNAVLGGRQLDSRFDEPLGKFGRYWSSTTEDGRHGWCLYFIGPKEIAEIVPVHNKSGISVRCVKSAN
jgi:uncharacterized protein (TIGR02145 family)